MLYSFPRPLFHLSVIVSCIGVHACACSCVHPEDRWGSCLAHLFCKEGFAPWSLFFFQQITYISAETDSHPSAMGVNGRGCEQCPLLCFRHSSISFSLPGMDSLWLAAMSHHFQNLSLLYFVIILIDSWIISIGCKKWTMFILQASIASLLGCLINMYNFFPKKD